jgi:hypothetical protein
MINSPSRMPSKPGERPFSESLQLIGEAFQYRFMPAPTPAHEPSGIQFEQVPNKLWRDSLEQVMARLLVS